MDIEQAELNGQLDDIELQLMEARIDRELKELEGDDYYSNWQNFAFK